MKSEIEQICLLCENEIKDKDFPDIIKKALERKYCANLNNFYFSRVIERILQKKRYESLDVKTLFNFKRL